MGNSKESSANKWNSFSYVAISAINFLLFTLVFKVFPSEIVGFYVLLNSIFFLGGNLDLGFGISTIKLIAEANRKDDTEYINSYFYTYLIAYFFLSILVLTLQYFYFIYFIRNLVSVNIDIETINNVYFLMSVNFLFTFMYSYLRSFLEGLFQYIYISKVLLISNILLLVSSFIVVLVCKNFIWFVLISALISVCVFIVYFAKIFKRLNSFVRFKYLKSELIKENIKYSIKLQISFFIGNSIDYIIKYLVTVFLSLGFVAIYESGKKFTTFINGFIYSTQKVILVKLSEVSEKHRIFDELKSDIYKYSNQSVKFIFLFYAVLNPAICIFLFYWFNNIDTAIVFLLLALPQTFICFLISLYNVIIIEGRGLFLITIQILNVLLISGLTIVWFVMFKSFWGLLGYYLATILTTLIIFYYFRRYHIFSTIEFLKNVKFAKIIILNILIIVEVIMLSESFNFMYVIVVAQIMFLTLYYNETISLFRNFYSNFLKPKI